MKKFKVRKSRTIVQLFVLISLIIIVAIYNLYLNEKLDFRIFSIGDMNPYGGWSTLLSLATDSSFEIDGVSKSAALTIAIIALAVVGGRFFCGWICPIGILQDLSKWIGNKLEINNNSDFKVKGMSLTFVKYPILLLILLSSIFGYGSISAELSPWRALLNLHNIGSAWEEMKIGYMVLLGILIASVFISRIFCRYLCPLGATQSLFSSISILPVKYSKACSSCNKCISTCSIGLQFSTDSSIVSPECIRCMECVESCKVSKETRSSINFGKTRLKKSSYIIPMIALFFVIWLGVPRIWGGHASAEDIVIKSLRDGIYEGEARGFAGKIITEVSISDGKITEIEIINHSESKGWYDEVFMLLPREIVRRQRLSVDAISGATKTSKGLLESIENAIRKAME